MVVVENVASGACLMVYLNVNARPMEWVECCLKNTFSEKILKSFFKKGKREKFSSSWKFFKSDILLIWTEREYEWMRGGIIQFQFHKVGFFFFSTTRVQHELIWRIQQTFRQKVQVPTPDHAKSTTFEWWNCIISQRWLESAYHSSFAIESRNELESRVNFFCQSLLKHQKNIFIFVCHCHWNLKLVIAAMSWLNTSVIH